MKNGDRIFISLGCVLLIGGITAYGYNAMRGEGGFVISFVLTMMSLLFFNLPTVFAKRRARKKYRELDENSETPAK